MGDNVFGIVRLLGMALRMSSLNLEEPSDKAFQVEVKKKKKKISWLCFMNLITLLEDYWKYSGVQKTHN